MVYKTGTNYALVRRSISGSPLRGGMHKFTPPQPRQTARPTQYIDASLLNVHLSEILRSTEHLQAVVHGESRGGSALFAATSERVLLLVQSATQIRAEDISLRMVAGLDLERQGAATLLTVFTSSDTHTIRTLDRASARHFVDTVDICHQTQHVDREMW